MSMPGLCNTRHNIFQSKFGPGSERSEEEIKEFWSKLSECVGSFGSNESVVVLGI